VTNVYTSVTTAGLGTNLVQAAYDLALGRTLNALPTFRQFVTKRPQRPSFHGSSITMNRVPYFDSTVVNAMKTPLVEEQDVDSTKMPATVPVTLTPHEYGGVVTYTELLTNRTFAPFRAEIVENIADVAAKVIDELIQDQLKADITEVTVDGGAESDLTTADVLTGVWIAKRVTTMRANNVPTLRNDRYVMVASPKVINDLRQDSAATGWREPHNQVDTSQIYAGEVGDFEGVTFVSNNRVRTGTGTGATTYNSYLFGQGGLAETVVYEPKIVVGPVVDKLQRFQSIGWKADLGWKVYEPLAVDITLSSSSLG
jgi:N4-gp56 family major capsid protein